jgi:hypothetical protein
MTSIEWLEEKFKIYLPSIHQKGLEDAFEKAKEMHKAEILTAFDEGQEYEYQYHINNTPKFDSETYYQETFGSNGSGEHICTYEKCPQCLKNTSSQTTSDKWKEYQDWLNEPPELSDEEIEKGAKEWYNKEGAYSASAIALKTWVYAIRWYREQLKCKG